MLEINDKYFPRKKWARNTNRQFTKEYKWPEIIGKILTLTTNQRNKNESNNNNIFSRLAKIKKNNGNLLPSSMGETPHSHTVPEENLATCTIYSKLAETSIKGKRLFYF